MKQNGCVGSWNEISTRHPYQKGVSPTVELRNSRDGHKERESGRANEEGQLHEEESSGLLSTQVYMAVLRCGRVSAGSWGASLLHHYQYVQGHSQRDVMCQASEPIFKDR